MLSIRYAFRRNWLMQHKLTWEEHYGLTVRAEGTTTVAGSTISGQSNGQLTVGTVNDINRKPMETC